MHTDPDTLIRLTPQQYNQLIEENARFREALERIANEDRVDPNAKYYAREALKD